MRTIFATTLIVGGLAMSLPASSQESKKYTLDECIGEAVRNNLTLRNADNEIAMSAEQRKEALTKYFPTVSAMGGGFTANKGLLEMDLGGMTMSLAKNGLVASITAMQPVFAGGQIVNGNKLAKVGEDVSRLQRRLSENDIRLSTEQYYWNIVMLKEKLRTLAQVDKQLVRMEADAQAAVDAGIRNRNDLLQVQLRKNETRASRIEVENTEVTMKDLLAQAMGHAGENIDVSCDVYTKPEEPLQFYQSPEASLASTKEYQLLSKQIEAGKLQYKLAVGKNLPP